MADERKRRRSWLGTIAMRSLALFVLLLLYQLSVVPVIWLHRASPRFVHSGGE